MEDDQLNLYYRRPDLYDLMHEDFVEDLRFVRNVVTSHGDQPQVLELGCGTGRLFPPMLDAGATVVGLDLCSTMLQVARDRFALYGDRVTLLQGDMRHFDLERRFDLAVIGLNTFMHMLTIDDQVSALESIYRHLRPGGILLLDLANPHTVVRDTPLNTLQHRFTRSIGVESAVVSLWSSTELALASQMACTTLFFDEITAAGDLQRTVAEVRLRLTYRFELEHLLRRAGFSIRALHGDYDGGPYEDESERLICAALALA
jgi:SAM-dependent methyltransferase